MLELPPSSLEEGSEWRDVELEDRDFPVLLFIELNPRDGWCADRVREGGRLDRRRKWLVEEVGLRAEVGG